MITLQDKIESIKEKLHEVVQEPMSIMEVCGTHTMAVARHAIRSHLPEKLNIISGPGCPVCVTSQGDIELALELARQDNFIICTFGDMLKVPSKRDSLQKYSNVKMIYSPLESLDVAKENPDKEVVLLGIGFETTVPLIASTIQEAYRLDLKNFTVLPMHKLVPPALDAIFADKENKIDGLLLPGHVSVVTGYRYFDFIEKYEVPGVVAGFEALDILESLYLLAKYINEGKSVVHNNYPRLVNAEGNKHAMDIMNEVYEPADSMWRKIGNIPDSGLKLKEKYEKFCALKRFHLEAKETDEAPGCLCGEILMGKVKPTDCRYFGKACTPINPIGPCMVSHEGTCAAYYKYHV